MSTHSLTTALTLYRSGTLSLAQAARQAGRSEAELLLAVDRYGIPRHESPGSPGRPGTPGSGLAD